MEITKQKISDYLIRTGWIQLPDNKDIFVKKGKRLKSIDLSLSVGDVISKLSAIDNMKKMSLSIEIAKQGETNITPQHIVLFATQFNV